jgi:hypothetical protein
VRQRWQQRGAGGVGFLRQENKMRGGLTGKVWADGGDDQRDEKQEWADREKEKKGKIGKKKEKGKKREKINRK